MAKLRVSTPVIRKGVHIPRDIANNKTLTFNSRQALKINGFPLIHSTYTEGRNYVHVYLKDTPANKRLRLFRQEADRQLTVLAKKVVALLKPKKGIR